MLLYSGDYYFTSLAQLGLFFMFLMVKLLGAEQKQKKGNVKRSVLKHMVKGP